MSTPPTPESMDRGGKGKTAIPEEKEDEPSLLPMTPESKQLAAVIATAVATAMAGRSASPDSSSSMVRYSAGVSLASRTRSIISIVRNLKLPKSTAFRLACSPLSRNFSTVAAPPRLSQEGQKFKARRSRMRHRAVRGFWSQAQKYASPVAVVGRSPPKPFFMRAPIWGR